MLLATRRKIREMNANEVLLASASAPAKAILFGEHAVNRGQSALATSVGLRVRCDVYRINQGLSLHSGNQTAQVSWQAIEALRGQIDAWRAAKQYEAIRQLAGADYFAAAKYVLANAFESEATAQFKQLKQHGLRIVWQSAIPATGGLGSGGASFAALSKAIAKLAEQSVLPSNNLIGQWAWSGDVVAHGGVASALDTQTALHGGVIRYTVETWGQPVSFHPGLNVVIGDTGMRGSTAEVNGHVRRWLEADAMRMRYFEMIGVLSRAALRPLAEGDWVELGKLMNLNQLVLEKIGVSTESLERLIQAALSAGAYGAKLSGSGGGGIMIALAAPDRAAAIAEAIHHAGGKALTPSVAVDGAT